MAPHTLDEPHRRDVLMYFDTYPIRSVTATHFTTALLQNDMDLENLPGLVGNQAVVRRVAVITELAATRAFDITFWKRAVPQNANQDLDTGFRSVQFLATDAVQVNPGVYATRYYYDSGDLFMPYADLDLTSLLHVGLVWRDVVAKVALDPFVVIVELDPGVV